MADWDVTAELAELEEMGVIPAEVRERIKHITFDGNRYYAPNRGIQGAVIMILHETRERYARTRQLAAGICEWRYLGGQWLIAGRNISPGQIVAVARRNGHQSDEIIGEIVTTRDGLSLARPGRL